jgi:hypothetical protein
VVSRSAALLAAIGWHLHGAQVVDDSQSPRWSVEVDDGLFAMRRADGERVAWWMTPPVAERLLVLRVGEAVRVALELPALEFAPEPAAGCRLTRNEDGIALFRNEAIVAMVSDDDVALLIAVSQLLDVELADLVARIVDRDTL